MPSLKSTIRLYHGREIGAPDKFKFNYTKKVRRSDGKGEDLQARLEDRKI